MDANQAIDTFVEFFEKNYKDQILQAVNSGLSHITINFSDLSKFDPAIADELLEKPEDIIRAAELSIGEFDVPEHMKKRFRVRFRNLPSNQEIMLRNIRSEDLNKLFSVTGVIRQKSDVRPQVTSAKFECPSCGNVILILQLDSSFKEPTRCGCGRKGKFTLLSKDLVDAQGIVLEESPDDLEGGEQPKRMNIFLKEDLVSPLSDKKTNPGTKINVVGMIKEVPIIQKTGAKSTRFDLLIEANYVAPVEENFLDIKISDEEERRVIELSKDPQLYKKIANSIAPSIYGFERVKEALSLQLVGGVHKKRPDGVMSRGDMHILLVGDPGSGKSQLLKRVTIIAPKGRYVSGKGVSGAGLTASVVKDEFLKGWSLEAGALVLASNGICCIDEMDKMTPDDRGAMHEALEQQTVSIAKANIQATLICRTTVLAAANPKLGRFDPYDVLANQIDLPPTLINRFDLIFPIKDMPNRDNDEKLAHHILATHQNPVVDVPDLDTDFLKKYVSYCRQRCFPVLTDGAIEEIKKYYVEMRNKGTTEEGAIRAIPISARQLEALVRMAEASAKLRLSDKVTRRDARKAIELLHACLSEIGVDPETGKIDIDRISTGVTASERAKMVTVREIINELEQKIGKTIPINDLLREAEIHGISEVKVEEALERLKRSGDIFEPKRGFIQKI